MNAKVEPEEAQAILSLLGSGPRRAEVAERDFTRPRRLSDSTITDLRRTIEGCVPQVERSLSDALGAKTPVELAGVRETSSDGLCADSAPPLAALRFTLGGAPGWVVWENEAATFALERLLGSRTGKAKVRRLSGVECRVLDDVLGRVARGFAESFGLSVQDTSIAQSVESMGSWRDAGPDADAHRLEIELSVEVAEASSSLVVYLPLAPSAETSGSGQTLDEIPPHLSDVDVEVSVRLEGCEVALDELLALEEGDVIPIRARVGDLVEVTVEGRPFARGKLGKHRGQLAVRIERDQEHSEELR